MYVGGVCIVNEERIERVVEKKQLESDIDGML